MIKILLIVSIVLIPWLLPQAEEQPRGGLLITSKGTLNVLCVFAQFPDDNYDVNNPAWPKGKPPARLNEWIDEKWTGTPRHGTLTDYFNVMSLGKYRFIGKTIYITTPNSRKHYLEKNLTRNEIHKEILQEADKQIDFAEFDNWKNTGSYKNENTADGIVDMILIVWRNNALDLPNSSETKNKMNLGWFGNLGTSLQVDNGKLTIADGSGATISDYFAKDPFRFTIHEFSHFLLGGNEFHNGHGFWAMCSGYEVRSFMINAYERYLLGWINDKDLVTINYKNTNRKNLTLPDFITTGKAYRIEIDASKNEYFYLENHQKISHWDKASDDKYPEDKGLFIIRQDYPYSQNGKADWMKLISAEGRFKFIVTKWEKSKWGPERLPVFKKGEADKDSGKLLTEFIPHIDPETKQPGEHEIIYQESEPGKIDDTPARNGIGKDAFRPGYKVLFSPDTNPDSRDKNGKQTGITVKLNSVKKEICNLSIEINKKTP